MPQVVWSRLANLTDARQLRKNCRGGVERVRMRDTPAPRARTFPLSRPFARGLLDPQHRAAVRNVINREGREQAHFCVRERSGLLAEPVSRGAVARSPVFSDRWFQSAHGKQRRRLAPNEGRAHDHYLVGTTVPERLRGGVRWRIRTGARHKSSEQRRCLGSSGCGRQPFEPTC